MEGVLETLLALSLAGSLLGLALLALRPLFRRLAAQTVFYYLWLLVLLRLVLPLGCPQMLEQSLSGLIPETALPISGTLSLAPVQGEALKSVPAAVQTGSLPQVLFALWLTGAFLFLTISAAGYLRLRRQLLREAHSPRPETQSLLTALCADGPAPRLLISEAAKTPMLLGLVRPCMLLPPGLELAPALEDILRHELTHHRRRDIAYKWSVVLVTALHWFNPLVYLFAREIARDCELSCDAQVLASLPPARRRRYGEALLTLASRQRSPLARLTVTMYSEKQLLRERLTQIVRPSVRSLRTVLLSLLLALLLTGCAGGLGVLLPAQAVTVPSPAGDTEAVTESGSAARPLSNPLSPGRSAEECRNALAETLGCTPAALQQLNPLDDTQYIFQDEAGNLYGYRVRWGLLSSYTAAGPGQPLDGTLAEADAAAAAGEKISALLPGVFPLDEMTLEVTEQEDSYLLLWSTVLNGVDIRHCVQAQVSRKTGTVLALSFRYHYDFYPGENYPLSPEEAKQLGAEALARANGLEIESLIPRSATLTVALALPDQDRVVYWVECARTDLPEAGPLWVEVDASTGEIGQGSGI